MRLACTTTRKRCSRMSSARRLVPAPRVMRPSLPAGWQPLNQSAMSHDLGRSDVHGCEPGHHYSGLLCSCRWRRPWQCTRSTALSSAWSACCAASSRQLAGRATGSRRLWKNTRCRRGAGRGDLSVSDDRCAPSHHLLPGSHPVAHAAGRGPLSGPRPGNHLGVGLKQPTKRRRLRGSQWIPLEAWRADDAVSTRHFTALCFDDRDRSSLRTR